MAADANIYASTMISPLQSVVRFTAAAAGTLFAQGSFVTAFQDQVGQSQSGGYPLWNNDATITGGQIPANQAYEVQGLSCFFALPGAGAAAVPTAIAVQALAANLQVQMNYAGQSYQLGRPVERELCQQVWLAVEQGRGRVHPRGESVLQPPILVPGQPDCRRRRERGL